jgi:FAD/FMN-containing dehydrogenase
MYGGVQDTARYEAWATDAVASVGLDQAAAYVNFLADEGAAGLSAAYPRATLERLRQVKAKYDPENLFRRNQNIPPAA